MTIGLLVSELKDAYVRDLCLGAKAAAGDHKAELIIFPGKLMAADTGHNEKKPYEFQHTLILLTHENTRPSSRMPARVPRR